MTDELNRRDVLRRALAVSGFAVSSQLLTAACATNRTDVSGQNAFSDADIDWLDEVAETILPQTQTPGAKAAEVGPFIALMVVDTFSPAKQQRFKEGMTMLEARCIGEYGTGFLSVSTADRLALLEAVDRERLADRDHYFGMIKELTVLGYFTSEIGYTQAMRYVETPGRFDPCIDLEPGARQWARHA